ncbi:hypothetical protein F4604DRAFT_1681422 [Suillus subluteus]|nr:hypothetical protein F4604DRAFT_1681422 [Suillus subluteus]
MFISNRHLGFGATLCPLGWEPSTHPEGVLDIDLPKYTELTIEIMDERRSWLWCCGHYAEDANDTFHVWNRGAGRHLQQPYAFLRDCLTRVLVGCAVGLVMLFVIWVVWDTRTAWWLYPISIRRCITVSLAKFCISRPSLEEGALMPLDNDSEAAGADSD